MTKTELRLKAGVSTNIIAKMGKGEPISMDNLAKIVTTLNCGFDDIVEIIKAPSKENLEDAYDLQCCLEAIEDHKANPVTYTSEQVMQGLGITQEELDVITPEEMEAFCKGTVE